MIWLGGYIGGLLGGAVVVIFIAAKSWERAEAILKMHPSKSAFRTGFPYNKNRKFLTNS